MDDLFRFITIRPPQSADTEQTISVVNERQFQTQLNEDRQTQPPFPAMLRRATAFVNSTGSFDTHFVSVLSQLNDYAQFQALYAQLTAPGATFDLTSLDKEIKSIFGKKAADLVSVKKFNDDADCIADSILAAFIAPAGHRAPVNDFVWIAQVIDIVRRVSKSDATLDDEGAVAAAMTYTIQLSATLFPVQPRIWPVGVADLLVVKQHLKRYELGEISHIENVLKGELKNYATKHTLTTSQADTTQNTTTTETENDLQTTDRFELQTESQNTVNEDIGVKAGVSASYKYGDSLQVNANVDVAYNKSKSDSVKTSIDRAKDVTSRAVTKITTQVQQTTTRTVTETFKERNDHKLDNTAGNGNVVGIYQWVNKVYEAQVFNYGKRLLFDITVPEPAAMLIDAATTTSNAAVPTAPATFTAKPGDLSDDPADPNNYFGIYAARYQASGIDAPPADHIVVCKGYSDKESTGSDPNDNLVKDDVLTIPEGYVADEIYVQGTYNTKSTPAGVNVFVGSNYFPNVSQDPTIQQATANVGEASSIAVAIETFKVQDYAVTVEVHCKASQASFEKWQNKTYDAIMTAYVKMLSDYQDALASLSFQKASLGPLGSNNPDDNRKVERIEIKKSAIRLISGIDLTTFNGLSVVSPPPPPVPPGFQSFPMPDPVNAPPIGLTARFFEEAFEWENMMYFFYPYYWGRKSTWYSKLTLTNDDPLFVDFLCAGSARAVIPVRPGFEFDVKYFLMTGQIWGGSGLPRVSDADYLPITQEIQDATDASPGQETPQGDPWEIVIPTTLVKLRSDGKLPGWARKGESDVITPDDWTWTANPPDA